MRGQHDLARHLLAQMEEGEEPAVGTADRAVFFQKRPVRRDQTAEGGPVERIPVPCVGQDLDLFRCRRQIAEQKLRDDPEVAAKVSPQQVAFVRLFGIARHRNHLGLPGVGDMHHLDGVQIVHRQAVEPRQQAVAPPVT